MQEQKIQDRNQKFTGSSTGTESANVAKKPRKTAEQREHELRDKMAKMQRQLEKLEVAKKEQQLKEAEWIVKRVKARIVSLGLDDVPPEAFENLLNDNAQYLREIAVKNAEATH